MPPSPEAIAPGKIIENIQTIGIYWQIFQSSAERDGIMLEQLVCKQEEREDTFNNKDCAHCPCPIM